ncbi:MAG: hypothetical protein ACOYW7_06075 [Nitrospirota bacterium]
MKIWVISDIYVLEGSPVDINGTAVSVLGAAQVVGAMDIPISAEGDTELLLVDVAL